MNFKYTVYNQKGTSSMQYSVFAPFGKSTITVRNNWSGETIKKEVYVKKRTLEANNLVVDYEDIIEYKVRVTDENDNFSSGMYATFLINGNTYSNSSDKMVI